MISTRSSRGLTALAAGIAFCALATGAASAATITGELIIGGTIDPTTGLVTGGTVIAVPNQSMAAGNFSFVGAGTVNGGTWSANISGQTAPLVSSPDLFDTTTVAIESNGLAIGTTLALILTSSGLTNAPSGLESSFTLNRLIGATYTGFTMFDGSEIASFGPFSGAPPSQDATDDTSLASSPASYSLTAEYTGTVTAEAPGTNNTINAEIDLSATPLPATLPLFAGGLGLLGVFGRRKKQNAIAAA
jgi:hypothetical protein